MHAFLGVKQRFPDWIKCRINEYGFIIGSDFVVIHSFQKNPDGGRPRTDYFLTVSMAKQLCMVERNEQGKKARLYFEECERIAKQVVNNPLPARLPDFNNPVIAARAWADAEEDRVVAVEMLDEAILLGQIFVRWRK
ncbi:MAG: antA/AntB antirepressor family protein [Desulfofustis sp.]|nr:antA/AntB antirepressor family protein [Desulfofustis sp.]